MKKEESQIRKDILSKIGIIGQGVDAASHKVAKEKLEKAADWLAEIHEQVKKLKKYCEENLQ